jgi:ribosomal protein L37AE/L43A
MENEYVYFITNPYYDKNIIKIGWTKNNPIIRIKTLSNPTGVPGAFNIEYIIKTRCGMGYNLEQQIHKYLKKYRINKQREFFRIDKEDLVNILVNELNLEIIYVSTNNTEENNTEENNTEKNNTEEKIKFSCEKCNYKSSRKYNYNRHLLKCKPTNNAHCDIKDTSHKHNEQKPKYTCNICNKIYMSRNGLWKHKIKCKSTYNNHQYNEPNPETTNISNNINNINNITPEIIMELIKNNNVLIHKNSDFKNIIIEQNNTINHLVKNGTNNNIQK